MEVFNLVIETSIPLLLGLGVSLYLKNVTRRLLADLCGTQDRSDFWVRVSTILITGIPLLLALAFGQSSNPEAIAGEVARRALWLSTFGIVIAVGLLSRAIMRSVPPVAKTTGTAQAIAAAPVPAP